MKLKKLVQNAVYPPHGKEVVTLIADIVETCGMATRREGGEVQHRNNERRTKLVVQENGKALTDRRCRVWLTGIINDPGSRQYDSAVNAFVLRAQDDLKMAGLTVNRAQALRLYRLFTIRGSAALTDAMKLCEDNDQSS